MKSDVVRARRGVRGGPVVAGVSAPARPRAYSFVWNAACQPEPAPTSVLNPPSKSFCVPQNASTGLERWLVHVAFPGLSICSASGVDEISGKACRTSSGLCRGTRRPDRPESRHSVEPSVMPASVNDSVASIRPTAGGPAATSSVPFGANRFGYVPAQTSAGRKHRKPLVSPGVIAGRP